VSEGLRLLRSLGAVNLVPVDGSRKDHFTAETSLRRLAGGYLRDRIEPYLRGGEEIESLRKVIASNPAGKDFQQRRINRLHSWHRFFGRVLPSSKPSRGKSEKTMKIKHDTFRYHGEKIPSPGRKSSSSAIDRV